MSEALPADPRQWGRDKVQHWLISNDCCDLAAVFLEHEIDGDVLLDLNVQHLEKLGINQVGKQMRLLKRIEALKNAGAGEGFVCSSSGTQDAPGAKALEEEIHYILDGRNIICNNSNPNCCSQTGEDTKQLRIAFEWFQQHKPNSPVSVFLYGARAGEWRQDPNLNGALADNIIQTPCGENVDNFLIQAAAMGLEGRRVVIVSNDQFKEFRKDDLDAEWFQKHTMKYVFCGWRGRSFLPSYRLDNEQRAQHDEALLKLLPIGKDNDVQPVVVAVSGQRRSQNHASVCVSPGAPATFQCPHYKRCQLRLAIGSLSVDGLCVRLTGCNAPKQREAAKCITIGGNADAAQCMCPTCGCLLEFRQVCDGTKAVDVHHSVLPEPKSIARTLQGKPFAFVGSIWAPHVDCHEEKMQTLCRYCVDALVLGYSMQAVGSVHDRVLLCTPDVKAELEDGWADLLQQVGWQLVPVEPINAAPALLSKCRGKFNPCFNKLRAIGLKEYTRIALLDLDCLARFNVDELADEQRYPAPMAVARVNKRNRSLKPGDKLNLQDFFNDETGQQRYGINAGVVIVNTDLQEMASMIRTVEDTRDPSHVATSGPEQDFLTRWPGYADSWRHLDLRFNFQPYQLLFAADGSCEEDRRWVPWDEVKLLHFSAEPKPSQYLFQDALSSVDDFIKQLPGGARAGNVADTVHKASQEWFAAYEAAWKFLTRELEHVPDDLHQAPSQNVQAKVKRLASLLKSKPQPKPTSERAISGFGSAPSSQFKLVQHDVRERGCHENLFDLVVRTSTGCLEQEELPAMDQRLPEGPTEWGSDGHDSERNDAGSSSSSGSGSAPKVRGSGSAAATEVHPKKDACTLIERSEAQIMKAVAENRIVIIAAATGSGKSTSVPRMLAEGVQGSRVACTQPRRIAATSLSKRVAQLWGVELGEEVGYIISGRIMVKEGKTRLTYMTTAIAMLLFLQQQAALNLTHLVIDEVHERSVFIDVLLTFLKTDVLPACQNLKVVLMSAAMDVEKLQKYFDSGGTSVKLLDWSCTEQRQYPLEIQYLDQIDFFASKKYVSHTAPAPTHEEIAQFVKHIILGDVQGQGATSKSILVFLAGKEDVRLVHESLLAMRLAKVLIVPMHGGMNIESQERALQQRIKSLTVILATDVVESSVTIPDVSIVVDTCVHKRRIWHDASNACPLTLEPISKGEATQRAGRAGRTGPGKAFRLVTFQQFVGFAKHAEPQILGEELRGMLLTLHDHHIIRDPCEFLKQMPDPPETDRVNSCIDRFLELNAMCMGKKKRAMLTHFGAFLRLLPLDPEVGSLVMNGLRYGVVDECVVLAAVHQRGDPFLECATANAAEVRANIAVKKACSGSVASDLIAGLMAYKAWRRKLDQQGHIDWEADEEASWCANHFLSTSKLHEIEELRVQIFEVLRKAGYHVGIHGQEGTILKHRRRSNAVMKPAKPPGLDSTIRPAQDIQDLIQVDHDDQNKRRLLHWCLVASFLHGTLEAQNCEQNYEIKYEPWPCQTNQDSQNAEHKTWIQTWLRQQGFDVKAARTRQDGSVIVTFNDPQSARLALHMGQMLHKDRAIPFRRCSKWGNRRGSITSRQWCAAECKISQTSLAAFPSDPDVTVVAAELVPIQPRNGESMFYLCTKCSIVPNALVPLVVMATYHSAGAQQHGGEVAVRAQFFGAVDEEHYSQLEDSTVMEILSCIRENLDSEFSGRSGIVAPDEQRRIVATRQMQVLELMHHVESNELKMVACPTTSGVTRQMVCLRSLNSGFLFDGGNGSQQSDVDVGDCNEL